MKTLFLFLLGPVLVFAQAVIPQYEEHFDIECSAKTNLGSLFAKEACETDSLDSTERIHETDSFDNAIELLITVEIIYVEAFIPDLSSYETVMNALPNYLDTFSWIGSYPDKVEYDNLQETLDNFVAMNDPMFPKEDTLRNWLSPVRYDQNRMGALQSTTEGFGPLFRF